VLESYRELLDLLTQTPTKLRDAANAAGDPPAGEWGAAQVLAHMAESERLLLDRLNQLMNQPEPLLRAPSREIQEYGASLMGGTIEDNLAAFNSHRGEVVSLLMGLSLRDWERTGTHEKHGEVTIADVVENFIDHDTEHLEQLESLA
jgi:hypothetical protein